MDRNALYLFGLFCICIACCKTPMPVTFNPDDYTNAKGTAASAKSTYELPPKNNNVRIKHDTLKLPHDTVVVRQ